MESQSVEEIRLGKEEEEGGTTREKEAWESMKAHVDGKV